MRVETDNGELDIKGSAIEIVKSHGSHPILTLSKIKSSSALNSSCNTILIGKTALSSFSQNDFKFTSSLFIENSVDQRELEVTKSG